MIESLPDTSIRIGAVGTRHGSRRVQEGVDVVLAVDTTWMASWSEKNSENPPIIVSISFPAGVEKSLFSVRLTKPTPSPPSRWSASVCTRMFCAQRSIV